MITQLLLGGNHVAKHYPWSSAGWWWMNNNMIEYCKKRPNIDAVGAKVNGRYLPNGATTVVLILTEPLVS